MSTLTRRAAVSATLCLLGITMTAATPAMARTALPPVERFTLDNGLEVLLLPNRQNPFFEIRFVARAGSAVDPAGKEGLASLTASMLSNGTPTRSEEDIARELEDMGASLHASAGLDSFSVQGTVVTLEPRFRGALLDLFREVLLEATFPDKSLEKTRALTLASIRRLADNHAGLAEAAFNAALYGEGPRGRMTSGNLTTVAGLSAADLKGMRDRLVIPTHSVIAVAGDFEPKAMRAWLTRHLGDKGWGKGVCTAGDIPGRCAKLCKGGECFDNPMASRKHDDADASSPAKGRRVLLVDRDDPSINQVQWRLGQDNPITLLAESWAAFRLGTQLLGGDFTARLNSVLRVREGLTYGARFNVDFGATDSGAMRVATYVAPKDVKKAIDLSLGEIAAVTGAPLPEAEIQSFKDKIINGFPFKFETVSSTLEQYLYLAVDGVDTEWLATYTDRLATPTPADVHRAMGVLTPDTMTLVAVGNRDLIPVLAEFGEVEVVSADDFLSSGLQKARGAE